MTESTFVQAALLLSLCLLPAAAQDAPKPAASGPVASKPAAKAKAQAQPRKSHSLFDYQKELGLTDDQISKMKAAVQSLQDKLVEEAKSENQASTELGQLVMSGADMKPIRAKLHEIADIEVERKAGDIETSRTISGVMTAEQREKWRAIQTKLSAAAH